MSNIIVAGTSAVNRSEIDTVNFLAVGTLNVAGTAAAPIDVTLSQVTTAAAAATINISYATVHVAGADSISGLVSYNIGNGGTLDFRTTLNTSVGSAYHFTGSTGGIVLANQASLPLLDRYSGFSPGHTIDLAGKIITQTVYADGVGLNTGGTLTLVDSNNTPYYITFTDGELTGNNFHLRSDGAGGTIVEFQSMVTGVTVTPANGTIGPNATVVFTVTTSNPIVVAGSPALSLNTGGVAIYDPSTSTPTQSNFRYTVIPGQNTADLAITGVAMNGATMSTLGGGAVDFTGAIGNPSGILAVDTIAPVATAITIGPAGSALSAGGFVTLAITLGEAVSLSNGALTLALNDGGFATYDPVNSSETKLVFRHIVQNGQNSPNLAIVGVNLNGTTATDAAGNALDLNSFLAPAVGNVRVDTRAPTITTVAAAPGPAVLAAGQTATFLVSLGEPVTLTGAAPTLTLNNHGIATLDTARSTATSLVFSYVVQPGQDTGTLAVTGLDLHGGTIADAAGNPLDLTGIGVTPPGAPGVDTINPTITTVAAAPGPAVLAAGQTATFLVSLGEPVTLTGAAPTLTLNNHGIATLDTARSTATSLVFSYVVQPGQDTGTLAVTGLDLHGGTIADAAGNPLDLTGIGVTPPGAPAVDTINPIITTVAAQPGNGVVGSGQTVTFAISPSEAVTLVGGVPTLSLTDGGSAVFDGAASTATNLVFRHVVQPGQNTENLAITGLNLHGGTIADAAGNALDLGNLLTRPTDALKVDTTRPVVTGVTTNPGSGELTTGQVVDFSVSLSEAVGFSGAAPLLSLSDGGTAIFDAARSTPTQLVFSHVVQAGQSTSDLAITAATLAGNTIADAAGNPVDLAGSIGVPPGHLSVDTTPVTPVIPPTSTPSSPLPAIIAVTATPGSGEVHPGDVVLFALDTNAPVSVTGGLPELALSSGGTAVFDPSLSTPTHLVFTAAIRPGENVADLAIVGSSLHGATIADAIGQVLSLSAAQVDPDGVLAVVDNSVPIPPVVTPDPVPVSPPPVVTPDPVSTPDPVPTPDPVVTPDPVPTPDPTPIADPTPSSPTQVNPIASNPSGPTSSPVTTQPTTGTPTLPPDLSNAGAGTTSPVAATTTTSASSTVSVYRFFDTKAGTHFYTASASERDNILANRPDLVPEGDNGVGLRAIDPASGDTTATEVFRFFDTVHGTQFLTASVTERDTLLATRSDLTFEPSGSFFEHVVPQADDIPVYRFFSSTDGTHFYTDNATERASIIQTRPDLIAEGIGFYEPK